MPEPNVSGNVKLDLWGNKCTWLLDKRDGSKSIEAFNIK